MDILVTFNKIRKGLIKVDKYLIFTLSVPLLYCVYYLIQGKLLLKGNSDAIDHQIPFFMAIHDAVSTDTIPSWTRFVFTGYSLISLPMWQWYPPNWVSFVVAKDYIPFTVTATAWLHFIGVSWAAFVYFREISKSSYWASVSAISYTFSLPVMYALAATNTQLPGHMATLFSLYIIHTAANRSWKLNIVYLALTTFAIITGTLIQFVFYFVPLICLYAIFIGFFGTESTTKDKRTTLYCHMGIVLGFVLSTPVLLPLLTMSYETSRDYTGMSLSDIYHGIKISPILLWRLFSPNAFGHNILLPDPSVGGINYIESMNAFCGVVMLFLAGYAITVKRSSLVIFWFLILVGMLLMTMTPLLYFHIILFGGKFVLNRITLLLPLAIASLAAIAGQHLDGKNQISLRNVAINPLWLLLIIAILYGIPNGDYMRVEILRGIFIVSVLIISGYVLCEKKIMWQLVILCLVLVEGVWSGHLMANVQVYPLMVKTKDYYTYGKPKGNFLLKDFTEQYRVVFSDIEGNRPAPPGAKEANQGVVYDYMSPWGYRSAFSSRYLFLLDKLCGEGKNNGWNNREVCFPAKPPYSRLADVTSVGFVVDPNNDWLIVNDRRKTCLPRASLFYEYEIWYRDFKQPFQEIPGLVGYWKFDGDAEDKSWNNNHGKWVGTESYTNDGVSGKAAYFDGANYVTVPHSSSLNVGDRAFTYGGWVNSKGHGTNQHFLNKRDGGEGKFWDIYLSGTCENINAEIADSSYENPQIKMPLSEWHHIVFTRDSSGLTTIYMDGRPINPKKITGDSSNTHNFAIGNLPSDLAQGLHGLIDEVFICNRSLSEDEVRMIYMRYGFHEDKEVAVARLKDSDFPLKKKVILTSNFNAPIGTPDPNTSVKFIKNGNSRVALEVKTKTPAILLLTDIFDKDWIARLDGKQVDIMEGNVAFRAVYIPGGMHEVEFKYCPSSLRLSLLISLIGISICVALYINHHFVKIKQPIIS